jgi:lysophospholipase L1-like esterase
MTTSLTRDLLRRVGFVSVLLLAGSAAMAQQPAAKPPVATPIDEKKDAKPAGQPAKEGEGPKLESSSMNGLVKMPVAATAAPREDAGWKPLHELLNARAKETAAKGDAKLLFIGDSITQGWLGEGKATWNSAFAKHGALNLGIGGDRTEHVLWRLRNGNLDGLDKPAAGQAPKVAVLMIGTNNSGTSEPVDTATGIALIVRELRARLPETKILLLAIFPREEKPGRARARNAKVNELIKPLGDGKHVFFLDIGASLTEADGTIDKKIMPDFLHLSPEGYARWAKAIEPALADLLK